MKAQQTIAEKHGCKIFPFVANQIEVFPDDSYGIHLETGRFVRAKKILIATGTYTGLLPLLGQATQGLFKLNMTYTAQVLAMIEVDEEEARRLK